MIRVFAISCSRHATGQPFASRILAPSKNLFFLGKSLDFAYLYANNGSVDKGLVPLLSAIKKQKDWFGSNSILSDGFVSKCIYRKTLFYGNWYSQVV